TANDSANASKDTVTSVSITSFTDPVTAANQLNVAVSGTAEAGDSIDLTVSDGTVAHDVTDSATATGGTWSFSGLDLSGLDDGAITYSFPTRRSSDLTANDSANASKDTAAPAIAIDTVTD